MKFSFFYVLHHIQYDARHVRYSSGSICCRIRDYIVEDKGLYSAGSMTMHCGILEYIVQDQELYSVGSRTI